MGADPVPYLPLVRYWARKYRRTPMGEADAFGYGCVALMGAADRFDSEDGATFASYAKHRVRGAMQDACRTSLGARRGDEAPVLVEDTFDWGSTEDRPFSHLSIVESLTGLNRTDQHAALLVAAGYRVREIAGAWHVSESRISQRLAHVRRHIAAVAA